ncbi:unnamed protein product [Dibothriocephalus latus]|uniref:Ion transport domain-containing protein n=1 Tax=Dibothriocephalus latus TaxID=60516 RepID=A0A3P7L4Y5_DIBLA|nr:unnamed protein product [Dibothriocephalus latus]
MVNVPHDFLLGTNLLWICRSTTRVNFSVTPPVQTTASMDWHNGIKSSLPVFLVTLICPLLLAIKPLQSWEEGPMDDKECSIEKANLWEKMKRLYNSARAKHMLEFASPQEHPLVRHASYICAKLKRWEYALANFLILNGGDWVNTRLVYLAFLIMITDVVLTKDTTHLKGVLEIYVMVHYIVFSCMDLCAFFLHWYSSSWMTAYRSAKTTPFTMFNYFTYVVFFVWLILRVADIDDLDVVQEVFVFFLILCYVRILDYLLVFRPFGPHILIMKPMLQEFSIFLVVIIIVLVPQAIALQRLSYPYVREFTAGELLSILEYPYYNLYGEIEPDGLAGLNENCDPTVDNCPVSNPIANVLQVLYLFFALVLLINLLIAVFR